MSRRRNTDLAAIERQRLLEEERQARARAEAQAVATGIAETACLQAQRGVEFIVPEQRRGERAKPIRKHTGLTLLHSRGRITDDMARVGIIYGQLFRTLLADPSLRSNLNRGAGGGGDRDSTLRLRLAEAEGRVQARAAMVRMHARLFWRTDLISALNTVCGRELTPRLATRNGQEAARLEALVVEALDLLVRSDRRGGYLEAA